MTCAIRHLLLLVLLLGVLCPPLIDPPVALAEEDPVAAAQARYLVDRDAAELVKALEPHAARLDEGALSLARLAASEDSSDVASAPLARLIDALRALDIPRARRMSLDLDRTGPAVLANWAGALVRARAGDDAGALARLMAPPLFRWETHAFLLALFGATLPDTDRLMLEATVRGAILRAAARRRTAALVSLAHAMAALAPTVAEPSVTMSLRALRRIGLLEAHREVLRVAGNAGLALDTGPIALERALERYFDESPNAAATIARRMGPLDGAVRVVEGLAKGGAPATDMPSAHFAHLSGEHVIEQLLARFATLSGHETEPGDVIAAARDSGMAVTDDGFATSFLEGLDFVVVRLAGNERAIRAVLTSGRPALFWRPVRNGRRHEDAPVLVRGYDPRAQLWIVDEPDLRRFALLPRDVINKGRVLCAAPRYDDEVLASLGTTSSAGVGAEISAAIQRAEAGDIAGAADALSKRAAAAPVVALYAAYLQGRASFGETFDSARMNAAADLIERSAATPPLLEFEAQVLGKRAYVRGEPDSALTYFDIARETAGASPETSLLRFAVLHAAGRDGEARAALDTAVRLDALDPHTLFMRATLLSDRGRIEAARSDVRRALDRRPESVDMTVMLAKLEVGAGRPGEALLVLDRLNRYAPGTEQEAPVRLARRSAEGALLRATDDTGALESFRRSSEPATRRLLAFTLAAREEASAELAMRALLIDDDPTVRVTTLRLYRRPWLQRRVESEHVLSRILTNRLRLDPEREARVVVAELLGRGGSSMALGALAAALAGPEADAAPEVRAAAAAALGRHDQPVARRALVAALEDVQALVRRAAVDGLYRLTGTTRAFEPEGPEADRGEAVARWQLWLAGR